MPLVLSATEEKADDVRFGAGRYRAPFQLLTFFLCLEDFRIEVFDMNLTPYVLSRTFSLISDTRSVEHGDYVWGTLVFQKYFTPYLIYFFNQKPLT